LFEIFGSASYYGIGKILKEYSRFPVFLPLPVNIQHGFVGERVSSHDARRDAPENWFWDEKTFRLHIDSFPEIKGRTVGAPFLYLLRLVEYSELPANEKKGSIVFPSHSSAFVKVSADFNSFADQLGRLTEEFHPITICAYHIDLERGDYQPFIDRGYQVVTNGRSLYDESFLRNFLVNVKDKKYAISNIISSSLFFSNALGVISYRMGPVPDFDNKDPHLKHIEIKKEEQRDWDELGRYFVFPKVDFQFQRSCVDRILGKDLLLAPDQMRKLLWRNFFSIKYILMIFKTFIYFCINSIRKYFK
jgi:hypothetical protein